MLTFLRYHLMNDMIHAIFKWLVCNLGSDRKGQFLYYGSFACFLSYLNQMYKLAACTQGFMIQHLTTESAWCIIGKICHPSGSIICILSFIIVNEIAGTDILPFNKIQYQFSCCLFQCRVPLSSCLLLHWIEHDVLLLYSMCQFAAFILIKTFACILYL